MPPVPPQFFVERESVIFHRFMENLQKMGLELRSLILPMQNLESKDLIGKILGRQDLVMFAGTAFGESIRKLLNPGEVPPFTVPIAV